MGSTFGSKNGWNAGFVRSKAKPSGEWQLKISSFVTENSIKFHKVWTLILHPRLLSLDAFNIDCACWLMQDVTYCYWEQFLWNDFWKFQLALSIQLSGSHPYLPHMDNFFWSFTQQISVYGDSLIFWSYTRHFTTKRKCVFENLGKDVVFFGFISSENYFNSQMVAAMLQAVLHYCTKLSKTLIFWSLLCTVSLFS